MRDILETNRPNILAGLQRFRQQIEDLENRLETGDLAAVEQLTAQGARNYEALIK
jgi:prephenate dehydrogenase